MFIIEFVVFFHLEDLVVIYVVFELDFGRLSCFDDIDVLAFNEIVKVFDCVFVELHIRDDSVDLSICNLVAYELSCIDDGVCDLFKLGEIFVNIFSVIVILDDVFFFDRVFFLVRH